MTDQNRPEGQQPPPTEATPTAVASPPDEQQQQQHQPPVVEEPAGEEVVGEEAPAKLRQEVEIKDIGPCKKHIKVVVDREDIDARMGDHFSKLVFESNVTGFRPGKAPRKLVEKRFFKEVGQQVKAEVLMASLQQLGDDYDLAPLSEPNIDIDKIEIPETGPMVYEFEAEVRPEFDLPEYRGLKLKRISRTFSDEDVTETRRRLLRQHGQVAPKDNGVAEMGDIVVVDMSIKDGDRQLGEFQESSLNVERQLAFKDGLIRNFADQIKGARAGDKRTFDVELSPQAGGGLGGKTVQAVMEVKDVKTVRLPDLTPEFVEENFQVASAEQLDELIRVLLERNLEHTQRRSARLQVLQLLTGGKDWQLPEDLLKRQFRRARARRIMEMRSDGLSDEEIAKKIRLMEQDLLNETAVALQEHFVLQKIAELEDIEVDEDDLNDEIERIADQTGESPRKVRARLQKDDMLDALMAEMIERKALDLILETAEYVEEDQGQQSQDAAQKGGAGTEELATVEVQAVPGQMTDMAAKETETEKKTEEPAPGTTQEGQ